MTEYHKTYWEETEELQVQSMKLTIYNRYPKAKGGWEETSKLQLAGRLYHIFQKYAEPFPGGERREI